MTGIYIICFVALPIAVLIDARKTYAENEFLDRQDVNVVKGVATIFVILAHLITEIVENIFGEGVKILKIFTVMGGMGVLIFFFLSGYGLYKGYEGRALDKIFWKKRMLQVYFPSVMIQFVFCMLDMMKNQTFDARDMVIRSFFGAWFIDVIMIQYVIFFVVCQIIKSANKARIFWCFLASALAGGVFAYCGFNARWYNGLLLFPFGMLMAYGEKKIIKMIQKRWLLYFYLGLTLFGITGAVFTYYKGAVRGIDIAKIFSGMFLCIWVCIVFCRIRLCSSIMKYIGKRSLYFYLIHVNILTILSTIKGLNGICAFYVIFLLMFPASEICYRMWNALVRNTVVNIK